MPMLRELASAKINLFLHVTGRRPDGYHLLDSVVVFAGAADVLTVEPAEGFSLSLTGPFAASLEGESNNLVLRAGQALARWEGMAPAAHLNLEKNLPVASGIGGGSADAAAALRLLSRFWNLDIPRADLLAIATRLGADVPVCLTTRQTRMSGIGEILSEAPVPPRCGILLVNPGLSLATPDVFAARNGAFSPPDALLPEAWMSAATMSSDLSRLRNDLEASAIGLFPEIAGVLGAIKETYGCLLARMSGSGATCFGIYPSADAAAAAAAALTRPGWWTWGGPLARG
ncbi:MAG: 4-(cytidine 5'-diphospho)-2-C-methyl-D-erythritol kinase [Acetobacteraceae bacterium]|nr:4-(cytidine 5'-diphospho)-2-C-methyl-D-erythritol kinase [Acetobacteraceae bacterium]MSP29493.1 4-(cytidine 5'-diphospho)-2-C-methyl-D-erythritol kinase [Acetobacteraceae bacterium]